jgi:hypothetical protein
MLRQKTRKLLLLTVSVVLYGNFTIGQVATGGQFSISQTAIAGGGSTNSGGGTFSLSGTTSQPVAGQQASNETFVVHAGFWIPDALIPTAEHVVMSGRVMHSSGSGIQNIRITMMSPDGTLRNTLTNTFGYFHFNDVEIGTTYVFTASSRKYTFQQTMLVRSALSAMDDLNFIALN